MPPDGVSTSTRALRAVRAQDARGGAVEPSPEASSRLGEILEENSSLLESCLRDHATSQLKRVLACTDEEIPEQLVAREWEEHDGTWLNESYSHHRALSDPVLRSRLDGAVSAFLRADIVPHHPSFVSFLERDRESLVALRDIPQSRLAREHRRALTRLILLVDTLIADEVSTELLAGRREQARGLLVAFRVLERDDRQTAEIVNRLSASQLARWEHIARCIALADREAPARSGSYELLHPELIGEQTIPRLAADRAIVTDDPAHVRASADHEVRDFGQLLNVSPTQRRQWRALARLVLREPGRLFGRNADDGSADLFLPVSFEPAFRLIARELADSPGWQGWLILRGSNLPTGGARWWLGARAGCQLPGGSTRSVCAVHPLGALSRRNDEAIAAARAKLPALGAEEARVIIGWQELARVAPGTTPIPAVGGAPELQDPADLVPGFYCAHEHGRWVLNDPQDALLLSCPNCGGERIACVPLHRVSKRRLLPPIDRHYLNRERFYRWLPDPDWDPQELTLEALDSEPALSLDPRDYAEGVFTPMPQASRVATLEDVLAARRRLGS